LAKNPKATKKRHSVIWTYGEDIQLLKNSTERFWYGYLCEKKRSPQELPIVDKGNSTCLNRLKQQLRIDQIGKQSKQIGNSDPTQSTIK